MLKKSWHKIFAHFLVTQKQLVKVKSKFSKTQNFLLFLNMASEILCQHLFKSNEENFESLRKITDAAG